MLNNGTEDLKQGESNFPLKVRSVFSTSKGHTTAKDSSVTRKHCTDSADSLDTSEYILKVGIPKIS
jgi:hypothetical protein